MSIAVLFDLDDTLIDLQYARRHGLRAVQESPDSPSQRQRRSIGSVPLMWKWRFC